MKINFINKELIKKLTAFTIATTMSLSGVPNIANASSVTVSSSNVCYSEDKLADYSTTFGDYSLYEAKDGAIVVRKDNTNLKQELILKKDGEATLTTQTKGFAGLVTNTKTDNFKIDYFDGENIKIKTDCIDNKDTKACVEAMKNYVNTTEFPSITYLDTVGRNVVNDQNKLQSTQNLYKETYAGYKKSFENSCLNIKEKNRYETSNPTILAGSALGMTAVLAPELGLPEALLTPQTAIVAIGLLGLISVGVAIDAYGGYSVALPNTPYPLQKIDLKTADLSKIAGWVLAIEAVDAMRQRLNDGIDNDYCQAIISQYDNQVHVNIANPLSKDQAKRVMLRANNNSPIVGSSASWMSYQEELDSQVYTYNSALAKELFKHMGGTPGPSNEKGKKYQAENHAFKQSFKNWNIALNMPDMSKELLVVNSPGKYYWHYHFYGKKDPLGQKNGKHLFFGIPVEVTQSMIDDKNKGIDVYGSDFYKYYVDKIVSKVDNSSEIVSDEKVKKLTKGGGAYA